MFGAGGGFAVFVVFVFVAVVGVMGVGMGDFGGTVEPAHFEDGTWGSLSLSFKKAYVVAILVFKRDILGSKSNAQGNLVGASGEESRLICRIVMAWDKREGGEGGADIEALSCQLHRSFYWRGWARSDRD
jgi:hypothetical protein